MKHARENEGKTHRLLAHRTANGSTLLNIHCPTHPHLSVVSILFEHDCHALVSGWFVVCVTWAAVDTPEV